MFSPEQIEMINRVDIRLRFGTHGTRDRHYLQAIRAVRELNPQRGDVLAVEYPGYFEGGSNYSAYIEPAQGKTLAQSQQEFLRIMRQSRFLHAFAYGALAATFQNIQVVNADANHKEWKPIKHLPVKETGLVRELYAIEDLGHHALRMAKDAQHSKLGRPVLMLLYGSAHQQSMKQLCQQEGVNFSSKLMPNRCDTIMDNADISLCIAKIWAHTMVGRAIKVARTRSPASALSLE